MAKSTKTKKSAARRAPSKPAKRAAGAARKPVRKGGVRKAAAVKRGVHDLGGLPGGPIDRAHHTLSPFEERVDALMMLLTNQHGIYKVDALRRAIESLAAREYRHLAYYEKWIRGIRMMLVEQGVLTDAEIDAKIAAIAAGRGPGAAA